MQQRTSSGAIRKKLTRILGLLAILSSLQLQAQILPELGRAEMRDSILKDKFQHLLPELMQQNEIDMWLVISREYNEDPVIKTMLPSTWLNARRRTILVFSYDKNTKEVEALAVARYKVGENIPSAWDKEKQPDQWAALVDLIRARDPEKIGVNVSTHFALADGLVKTDHAELMEVLPEEYKPRVVSAEALAIGWIETRTPLEMELYPFLVETTHKIIDEAFSTKVIKPGVTSTEDVVWWMRQKVTDLGLETWFHPTIDVQRSEEALKSHIESFSKGEKAQIIQEGDLLHCDFGITYLGLNTDCQQHAYVAKEGETAVPDFLAAAFKTGNRVQDIFTANFEQGKTGNEILAKSLAEGKAEGLKPAIYTHPLGLYGHSAGTTLGMWDSQGGVPFTGDYPLHYNTVYAIELNNTTYVEPWKKEVRIMLEEAGFFGEEGFRYVGGRQEAIKLIR